MILRLVREQLRSGRRYTAWSGLLLVVAVALASTAFVGASTQVAAERQANDAWRPQLDYLAWVAWWTNGMPDNNLLSEPAGSDLNVLQPGDLEAMVDEAQLAGGAAVAQRHTDVWATSTDAQRGDEPVSLVSRYPAADWDTVLIAGSEPETGEVVLAADLAERLDVGVGHEVRLASEDPQFENTVTVSGLSRPSAEAPFWSLSPSGYLLWEDGLGYASELAVAADAAGATEATTQMLHADLTWDEGAIGMANLEPLGYFGVTGDNLSLGFTGWPSGAMWAAGLVGLAMIAATFAMARSQAQRRIQWVATARVLGARRSTVVAASAGEALVIGVVASAVGIAMGYIAVAGLLGFEQWRTPGALLPSVPALAPIGLLLLLGFGLLLAIFTAVAPAFWATRVAPVAALRPVTPFSEAQLSRQVSARWLAVMGTLGVASVAAGAVVVPGIGQPLQVLGVAAVVVIAVAAVVELGRRGVAQVGRLVARTRHPWAAAVDSALTARWRSSGTAAAIVGLTAAGIVAVVALGAYNAAFGTSAASLEGIVAPASEWAWRRAIPTWAIAGVMAAALALAALVVAAITSTARLANVGNDAVQSALGLSPHDARRAAGVEIAIPIAVGALVGPAVGWMGSAIIALLGVTETREGWAHWGAAATATLATAGMTILIAAAVAVVAALVTAWTTQVEVPVRELARAAR